MKAIKVTHKLKHDNPKLFGEVGSIYSGSIPKTFKRGNETVLAYDQAKQLQDADGWKEVIVPDYNSNTQRLGNIIESETGFTREVIDYTEEELAAIRIINEEI